MRIDFAHLSVEVGLADPECFRAAGQAKARGFTVMASKTEIVKGIVAKNPEATYSDHKEECDKAGISPAYFSLIKGKVKNGDKPAKAKTARKSKAPAVDLERAIEFVKEAGGVEALKAKVAESQSYLAAVEKLLAEVA
jgi:hypothetical protein